MQACTGFALAPRRNERPYLPQDEDHHRHNQHEIAGEQPDNDGGGGLDRRQAGQNGVGGKPGEDREDNEGYADERREPPRWPGTLDFHWLKHPLCTAPNNCCIESTIIVADLRQSEKKGPRSRAKARE